MAEVQCRCTKYKMVGLGKRSEYCELPLTEYQLFTENKNWPKRTPRGWFIFSGFQVQIYSSGYSKHRVSIVIWFNFTMGLIYNPCISRICGERKRGEGGGMGLSRFSSESSQNQICPKENTFSSSFYWICCGFYLPCISGCIRGREQGYYKRAKTGEGDGYENGSRRLDRKMRAGDWIWKWEEETG